MSTRNNDDNNQGYTQQELDQRQELREQYETYAEKYRDLQNIISSAQDDAKNLWKDMKEKVKKE